jgi:hypothetical protein
VVIRKQTQRQHKRVIHHAERMIATARRLIPLAATLAATTACGRVGLLVDDPVVGDAARPARDSSVTGDVVDVRDAADPPDSFDALPVVDSSTGIVTLAAPRAPRAMSTGFGSHPVVYTAEDEVFYRLFSSLGTKFPQGGNWGVAIAKPTDGSGVAWALSIHPGRVHFESDAKDYSTFVEAPSAETPTHYGAIMAMTADTRFFVDQRGTDDEVVSVRLDGTPVVVPALADHGACFECPPMQIGHVVAIGFLRFYADARGLHHVGSLDDSGAPETLLASFDEPTPDTRVGNDLTSDGTTVFYSDVGVHRQRILAVPILGGTPRVVVDGIDGTPGPRARPRLALLGDTLYYADGSNRVMAVPKTGGASVEVAAESKPIVELVASGKSVYWILDGALRRADR